MVFTFIVRQKAKFMRGLTYFNIANTLMLVYLSFRDYFVWYQIIPIVLTATLSIWLVGHMDIKKNVQQKENEIVATWNPVLVNIQDSLKRIEEKL
jgi:predicted thioredoxin/glutaredoxin